MDAFITRQVKSNIDQRTERAKLLTRQITDNLGYNLRELERGDSPSSDVTDKVTELYRLYAELSAIKEITAIYATEDQA